MQGINRYNSIQAIALNRIVRKREQTYDNYEYYTQILRDYARMLNLKTPYGIRVFRGYANAAKNGQIQLPEDYVKYVAVGVDHCGQLKTLTYDRSMIMDAIPTCDNVECEIPTLAGGVMFPEYLWGGVNYPAMMSVGGGFNEAYFSEDRIGKRIGIRPKLYDHEIVIYYVSYGDLINDYTVIPAPYVEVAHKWIDKIETESSVSASDNAKNEAKRRYDIAMLEALPLDSDMNYIKQYLLEGRLHRETVFDSNRYKPGSMEFWVHDKNRIGN